MQIEINDKTKVEETYRQTYTTGAYADISPAIAVSCNIHGHILQSSFTAARSNENQRITSALFKCAQLFFVHVRSWN